MIAQLRRFRKFGVKGIGRKCGLLLAFKCMEVIYLVINGLSWANVLIGLIKLRPLVNNSCEVRGN